MDDPFADAATTEASFADFSLLPLRTQARYDQILERQVILLKELEDLEIEKNQIVDMAYDAENNRAPMPFGKTRLRRRKKRN